MLSFAGIGNPYVLMLFPNSLSLLFFIIFQGTKMHRGTKQTTQRRKIAMSPEYKTVSAVSKHFPKNLDSLKKQSCVHLEFVHAEQSSPNLSVQDLQDLLVESK